MIISKMMYAQIPLATGERAPPRSYYEIIRKRSLNQKNRDPETTGTNLETVNANHDTIPATPDPNLEVFIYNLPPDVSLETLKIRFQCFGRVAKVRIARWPGLYHTIYAIYYCTLQCHVFQHFQNTVFEEYFWTRLLLNVLRPWQIRAVRKILRQHPSPEIPLKNCRFIYLKMSVFYAF